LFFITIHPISLYNLITSYSFFHIKFLPTSLPIVTAAIIPPKPIGEKANPIKKADPITSIALLPKASKELYPE